MYLQCHLRLYSMSWTNNVWQSKKYQVGLQLGLSEGKQHTKCITRMKLASPPPLSSWTQLPVLRQDKTGFYTLPCDAKEKTSQSQRVFLICMCWVINSNKTTEGFSTRSVYLSFPSGCSSPSWHLLVLSQSGTPDSVGTTQLRQRCKPPEQSADTPPPSRQLADSEIGPRAGLHATPDQSVGTCCFTCWYR